MNILSELSSFYCLLICVFVLSLSYQTYNKKEAHAQPNGVERKVLITGFYDWRELGVPPQTRRCKDNPSCRVLAGEGIGERDFKGGLSVKLQSLFQHNPSIKISFQLLPVTWESLGSLERTRYDTFIHLGLGVYDSFHKILIEDGAFNYYSGIDAKGHSLDRMIYIDRAEILQASPNIQKGIERALQTKLPEPFTIVRAKARRDNTYLCNATHYEALEFISSAKREQTVEAYFIHIPHSEGGSDEALALALLEVIKQLINR
jgi:pyrrolidone-carboxylate peptidase